MSFRIAKAEKVLPRTRERALATATLTKGALLTVNGSGQYAECGADPAAVAAVALSAAGTGNGAEHPIGYKEFPPGYMQAVLVSADLDFIAEYVGALGTIGTAYGVVKGADGVWRVDFGETSSTVVTYIENPDVGPMDFPFVLVRFRAAVIQPS